MSSIPEAVVSPVRQSCRYSQVAKAKREQQLLSKQGHPGLPLKEDSRVAAPGSTGD